MATIPAIPEIHRWRRPLWLFGRATSFTIVLIVVSSVHVSVNWRR
jgi:hypothetical protein